MITYKQLLNTDDPVLSLIETDKEG